MRVEWKIHEAKPSAVFVMRLSLKAVHFIQTKRQCLSVLAIVFYKVLTKYSSLVILTHLAAKLLNKQRVFFDKMCQ